MYGPERVQFFIHSPFGWRQNESEIIDRNQDSVVFQATFLEGGRETYALFMSDINYDSINQIVTRPSATATRTGCCGTSSRFRTTAPTPLDRPGQGQGRDRSRPTRSSGCARRRAASATS